VNNSTVACPNCRSPLPAEFVNASKLQPCPVCQRQVEVEIFPAFFRSIEQGTIAERIVIEDQSSCYFHPQKKAVMTCERCGRFLCSLCDLELHGEHICPPCLQVAQKQTSADRLQNHRILYDNVALGMALLPIIAWPLTIVTAPAALFMSFFFWKWPSSIIRRGKLRLVLAMIFSVLEMAAWIIVLALMWYGKI
jgi:hypothetical protein